MSLMKSVRKALWSFTYKYPKASCAVMPRRLRPRSGSCWIRGRDLFYVYRGTSWVLEPMEPTDQWGKPLRLTRKKH